MGTPPPLLSPFPPRTNTSHNAFSQGGGGGAGNSALDRDFRQIVSLVPLEDKRALILQYGDEASKRRAHGTTPDGKACDVGTKVCK